MEYLYDRNLKPLVEEVETRVDCNAEFKFTKDIDI